MYLIFFNRGMSARNECIKQIERILGVIYWASSHHMLLAEGAGVAAQTIFTLRFSSSLIHFGVLFGPPRLSSWTSNILSFVELSLSMAGLFQKVQPGLGSGIDSIP